MEGHSCCFLTHSIPGVKYLLTLVNLEGSTGKYSPGRFFSPFLCPLIMEASLPTEAPAKRGRKMVMPAILRDLRSVQRSLSSKTLISQLTSISRMSMMDQALCQEPYLHDQVRATIPTPRCILSVAGYTVKNIFTSDELIL